MLSSHREPDSFKCVCASRKPTLRERRRALREQPGLTFVQREEFCELLLSNRRLVRSDERSIHIRGLLDPETGERFLIEQERLMSSRD
jgi:hypothetical protein